MPTLQIAFLYQNLNKPEEEYKFLQSTDAMWFCVKCRESVEKNIATDLKIEERCKEIMKEYECRISTLEQKVEEKCDEAKVREIITEELHQERRKEPENQDKVISKTQQPCAGNNQAFESVIQEINERKSRENNLVIYGANEIESDEKDARKTHDSEVVRYILKVCGIRSKDAVIKVTRLGRYKPRESQTDEERKSIRPILLTLNNQEIKSEFFKKIKNLQTAEKYKKIRVANDLTKSEREKEKQLREEAKKKEENSSGEAHFRVRGPPWARRIVKILIKN